MLILGLTLTARRICLLFITALLTSCSSVRVHPHSSEAKIREAILQHTPLGSPPSMVLKFIDTRLRHNGPARLEEVPFDKEGRKIIRNLEVGWYWTVFPLLPEITYVYVSWTFDAEDRLIAVSVSKEIEAV